jgi:hypothetical protein
MEWRGPFSFSGLLSVAVNWQISAETVAHATKRRRDHAIWHDPNCNGFGARMG